MATNDDADWNPTFARAYEAAIDQIADADTDRALDLVRGLSQLPYWNIVPASAKVAFLELILRSREPSSRSGGSPRPRTASATGRRHERSAEATPSS